MYGYISSCDENKNLLNMKPIGHNAHLSQPGVVILQILKERDLLSPIFIVPKYLNPFCGKPNSSHNMGMPYIPLYSYIKSNFIPNSSPTQTPWSIFFLNNDFQICPHTFSFKTCGPNLLPLRALIWRKWNLHFPGMLAYDYWYD